MRPVGYPRHRRYLMNSDVRTHRDVETFLQSVVMVFFVLVSMPTVVRADCIDYGEYFHWVGSVDTPSFAHGVAVSGTVAYVAGYLGL